MKTIKNTKLFNELKKIPKWDTLFKKNCEPKDYEMPILQGGLDHIEVKKKGVYFYDRGCNGRSNDFVIRPDL